MQIKFDSTLSLPTKLFDIPGHLSYHLRQWCGESARLLLALLEEKKGEKVTKHVFYLYPP